MSKAVVIGDGGWGTALALVLLSNGHDVTLWCRRQERLEQMKQSSLAVCVVSNSHNSRVPDFCKTYGIDCITHANKPFSKGIKQCLSQYNVPAEQAVLVGDQIFTDTLGGGCAGVRTILVKAIHNHTILLKLRHIAELPFIFLAKNRRIKL